jgi:phi13 family phage major tail protein
MPVVGLRDFHVAIMSGDGTYEVPAKIAPAISANITPNFNITTLYGDDQAVAVAEALGDIDVELNITDLTPDDYALILGKTKNTDGVVEDSTEDIAPYLALGFKLPKESGGFRHYWYYKGKFNPPSVSHNTKAGTPEFQTATISGKFMAREDKKWRAHMDSDDPEINQAVVDAWFNDVYEPTPEV